MRLDTERTATGLRRGRRTITLRDPPPSTASNAQSPGPEPSSRSVSRSSWPLTGGVLPGRAPRGRVRSGRVTEANPESYVGLLTRARFRALTAPPRGDRNVSPACARSSGPRSPRGPGSADRRRNAAGGPCRGGTRNPSAAALEPPLTPSRRPIDVRLDPSPHGPLQRHDQPPRRGPGTGVREDLRPGPAPDPAPPSVRSRRSPRQPGRARQRPRHAVDKP